MDVECTNCDALFVAEEDAAPVFLITGDIETGNMREVKCPICGQRVYTDV
jgi:uncharacterized Zn-finger protein